MSSTRPGNQERGWNDPPEFLHNNTEAAVNLVTNQRTILNKRVGYNFAGAVNSDASGVPTPIQIPSGSAPVIFASTPPRTPTLAANMEAMSKPVPAAVVVDSATTTADQELSVLEIEEAINEKLSFLKEAGVSAKVIDDIAKRVKVFVASWEKLSNPVRSKMSELANALKNKDFTRADDIHVRLMMDYSSEVIQWMVGIKKLIHELKTNAQAN